MESSQVRPIWGIGDHMGQTCVTGLFNSRRADTLMSMPTGTQPAPGPLSRAFSSRVRIVMADARVTKTALAKACGVSRNYLGKRLRDEAPFSLNDVEAICRALGIPMPKI